MAAAIVFLFLGLLSIVVSKSPNLPASDKFEQKGSSKTLEDIIRSLACLDGSCDLVGQTQFMKEPGSPVLDERRPVVPVIVETVTPVPVEPVKMSPYLEECIHLVSQQEHLRKDPKIKSFEDKHWGYYQNVLSVYNQYPEKRNELMVAVLEKTIQLLLDLKHQYESEMTATRPSIPVQPTEEPVEEIIAEEVSEVYPPFIGSVRGIPGVHYPNYTEVPITSFSCGEQDYIPGFYADLETGCQVFHVCYEHRRESFLCPIGTVFNQPILACDYWYSSNCSLSPHYYDVNAKKPEEEYVPEPEKEEVQQIITTIIEHEKPIMPTFQVKSKETETLKSELQQIVKFLPVKAKILEFPLKPAVPKPLPQLDPKFMTAAVQAKFAVAAAVPAFKAGIAKGLDIAAAKKKVAGAALGLGSAAGVLGKKKVISAAGVGKLVGATVAKPKIAAVAKGVSVTAAKKKVVLPLVKAKALPVLKAAKALPLAKTAAVKSKIALTKGAALPLLKTKAALISPLTKKALALGYIKLLKAKKLALMG